MKEPDPIVSVSWNREGFLIANFISKIYRCHDNCYKCNGATYKDCTACGTG